MNGLRFKIYSDKCTSVIKLANLDIFTLRFAFSFFVVFDLLSGVRYIQIHWTQVHIISSRCLFVDLVSGIKRYVC